MGSDTKRPPKTNLFHGSHRQSFQNSEFRTAGNDMYRDLQPTYNLHINAPRQQWSQIFQQVARFFRSPDNQATLQHQLPGPDGPSSTTGSSMAQYSPDSSSQRGSDPEDHIDSVGKSDSVVESPGHLEEDCSVHPISDLTPQLMTLQERANAEIYTRCMLHSKAGLPCWYPRPRKPVGEQGIVPGDVGTFDLIDGFKKIFNLWDGSLPQTWQLPPRESNVLHDHFAEGHTFVNGTSSKIGRSEDGESTEWFQFRCNSEQGAVLACTSPADLEELLDPAGLLDFLVQCAGAVYQQANTVRTIADEDSLYVVSGCIKSDSWGLAAYRELMGPPDDVLLLSRRKGMNNAATRVPTYDWLDRGTAEARFGSNLANDPIRYQGKDQCLFLRGFKVDFSQKIRSRLNSSVKLKYHNNPGWKDTGLGGESPSKGDHDTGGYRGCSGNSGQSFSQSSGLNVSADSSSMSAGGSSMEPEETEIYHFPESQVTGVHPCDRLTNLLLDMTGADCAISHDDDWMQHAVTESSWTDEAYLDIVSSRTITVVNGVAHFLPKSGVRSLQIIASSPVGNDAGHKVLADNPKQLDLGIGNSVARPLATPEGPAARSSHCTYDIFFTGRDDPRGCIVIGEETEPVYFCFETAEKALPRARTIVYAGNQNYVAKLDWSPGNHLGSATIGSRQIPMLQMVLPGTSPQARAFNCLDGRRYEWRRLRDNPTSYDLYSLTGVPSRIAIFRRYAQATVVGPSHAMVQYTFENRELLIEALLALCINRCMDLLSVSAADLTTIEDVSI